MVVGEMPEAVDLMVVGAGPGGCAAALRGAELGRNVVIVDQDGDEGVGGVCLLEGCIPSKALIELADAVHSAPARAQMGVRAETVPQADLSAFQAWKSSTVRTLGDGLRQRLRAAGVRVVRGRATFLSRSAMRIEREDDTSLLLEFRGAVVATGSTAAHAPALDLTDPRVVDSAGVLALTELPRRVVVVGCGYVGVELGTALRKLGSDVTIVDIAASVLAGLEPALSTAVSRGLRRLGCNVLTSTGVVGLSELGVVVETEAGTRTLPADLVVSAVGRRPATARLGLELAGVSTSATGHIDVTADLRATPVIAAIGDATTGPGLAHKATAEAEVAVSALSGRRVAFDAHVPLVVFSSPEVASVGLTTTDAAAAGHAVGTTRTPMSMAGRSLVMQRSEGFMQLVYDLDTRALLGAHVAGAHASELVAEATLAIEMGALVDDVAAVVHAHPTLAELYWEAARATSFHQPTQHQEAFPDRARREARGVQRG